MHDRKLSINGDVEFPVAQYACYADMTSWASGQLTAPVQIPASASSLASLFERQWLAAAADVIRNQRG